MKKNTRKNRTFLQKMRFQYRLSVLNENTLEESWHIRLSRLTVLLYGSLLFCVTFALLTFLIFATPVRYYLPGYGGMGMRAYIITESLNVDSLQQEIEIQSKYLDVVKGVITGELNSDSIASLDSAQLKEMANVFLEKSKAEKEFIEKYEKSQKYNLENTGEVKSDEEVFVFFRPVKGVISSTFNLSEERYGIDMITSLNETVVSVLSGTVVYAGFTFDSGWVIQVQHEDDYLSIYKNNTRLLKKAGDNVRAGEGIAIAGEGSENKQGNHFYFELWQQGKPINPESVIIF